MRVSSLPTEGVAAALRSPGIRLHAGPVVVQVTSPLPRLAEDVARLYADYRLASNDSFVDFYVRLDRPRGPRRWIAPQVLFFLDDKPPFKPLPLSQAFAVLEWGLNWCVATHLHDYLILHAAVVARNGRAVIMPGLQGAGKSTLCAGLVSRGWRLLSDEMALVAIDDGYIAPVPRPISLKNESIRVLRDFAPDATFGRECADTRKGVVSHMKPPGDSIAHAGERAVPAWIVAPHYEPGARGLLQPEPKPRMFMSLADNAFNYHILGPAGFRTLGGLIDQCDCFQFEYGDLEQAVAVFDALEAQEGGDAGGTGEGGGR